MKLNEMKTKILFAVAATIALAAGTALAQDGNVRNDWQEKMKAQKIAFLTDRMDLTSGEATLFWPVYNRAEKEKRESFKEIISSYKALQDAVKEGKSEAEIKGLLFKYSEAKKKNEAVDNSYIDEYLKVLPAAKVAKLYLGEEQFRRQQIHRLNRPGDAQSVPGKGTTRPGGRSGNRSARPSRDSGQDNKTTK